LQFHFRPLQLTELQVGNRGPERGPGGIREKTRCLASREDRFRWSVLQKQGSRQDKLKSADIGMSPDETTDFGFRGFQVAVLEHGFQSRQVCRFQSWLAPAAQEKKADAEDRPSGASGQIRDRQTSEAGRTV
jgi:hypothetical protein